MKTPHLPTALAACALGALLFAAPAAHALPGGKQFTPPDIAEAQSDTPPPLKGVDVVEHLGELLPLETRFTDSDGREVTLGEVLPRTKPVLFTLAYYRCEHLCNLVINEQIKTMRGMGLELGRDYEALTVSIDPTDTPAESAVRRQRHLQALGRTHEAPWHFLTGSEQSIRRLADAVGFKYTYDEKSKQYGHPAVVHVLTPEGSVSRYLYGASFSPKDMKLALLEAAGGRVGTSVDRIILSCFKYDAAHRRYGFYIFGFLRVGAALIFSALACMLAILWRRELKKGTAV